MTEFNNKDSLKIYIINDYFLIYLFTESKQNFEQNKSLVPNIKVSSSNNEQKLLKTENKKIKIL